MPKPKKKKTKEELDKLTVSELIQELKSPAYDTPPQYKTHNELKRKKDRATGLGYSLEDEDKSILAGRKRVSSNRSAAEDHKRELANRKKAAPEKAPKEKMGTRKAGSSKLIADRTRELEKRRKAAAQGMKHGGRVQLRTKGTGAATSGRDWFGTKD